MENLVLFVAFSVLLTFADVMSDVSEKSDNLPNVADCPKIYQRFSTTHTFCQPKKASCDIKDQNVSKKDADMILDLHNKYRSIIATQGEGNNGNPPASNMMYMEWDEELAAVAQKHTERCIYEHDLYVERRVRNFGVGQNIVHHSETGGGPLKPDWEWAIGQLYELELKNFKKSQICNYPSPGEVPLEVEIGHTTQLIWAKSFRIGCGYTMYKEGDTYHQLYTCNYGPEGNIAGTCVFEKGPACSKCPGNTACTKDAKYPGLCQRTNNEAPYTPITEPALLNCNFRDPNSPDCKMYSEGANSWSLIPALGGQFLETILQPGQNATLVFDKKFTGTNGAINLCFSPTVRRGPDLAINPQNDMLKALFFIPVSNYFYSTKDFKSFLPGNARQQFATLNVTLRWYDTTNWKISFAVPKEATPQFFNLESVVVYNNPCPKKKE